MHMSEPIALPTSLLGVLTTLTLDTPEFRKAFETAIADELGVKLVSYEVEEDGEQKALLLRAHQPLSPRERHEAFIFTRGWLSACETADAHDAPLRTMWRADFQDDEGPNLYVFETEEQARGMLGECAGSVYQVDVIRKP
jgi:hypothetical protein